jgi:hypothetical protein
MFVHFGVTLAFLSADRARPLARGEGGYDDSLVRSGSTRSDVAG